MRPGQGCRGRRYSWGDPAFPCAAQKQPPTLWMGSLRVDSRGGSAMVGGETLTLASKSRRETA